MPSSLTTGRFVCTYMFDERDPASEHTELWILNERLVWDIGRCLRLLGQHAVRNCGAWGDALVEARLVAKAGQGMRLVFMQPLVPGSVGPAEMAGGRELYVAESGHTVVVEATTAVGPPLVVATRLLATDLFHAFGSPEVRQIAAGWDSARWALPRRQRVALMGRATRHRRERGNRLRRVRSAVHPPSTEPGPARRRALAGAYASDLVVARSRQLGWASRLLKRDRVRPRGPGRPPRCLVVQGVVRQAERAGGRVRDEAVSGRR